MVELRIGAPCSNCGAISGMCRCGEPDAKNTTMIDLIKQIYESEEQLKMKCEHVSDGIIRMSDPPQLKCKKCGEYYR